jgi:hypothetical protein
MPRSFELFDRSQNQPVSAEQPMVTLRQDALMSVNHAAFIVLGEPEAVLLFYDRAAQVIGLHATTVDDARGYHLRKVQTSRTYILVAYAFIQHYGIRVAYTQRYPATLVDDILEVDLTGPSEEVVGPRNRRRTGGV